MKKILLAAAFSSAFSVAFFGQRIAPLRDLLTLPIDSKTSSDLAELGGSAYFIGSPPDAIGLFRTDGSSLEMVKNLRDACELGQPAAQIWSNGERLFIFLQKKTGVFGWELWASDGAAGGTERVAETISFNQKKPVFLGEKVIFYGTDKNLYAHDGFAASGLPVGLMPTGATTVAYLGFETTFDGRVFFLGHDTGEGQEIWATDGSATAVAMPSASGPSGIRSLCATGEAGGKKLFLAQLDDERLALFAVAAGSSQLEKLAEFGTANPTFQPPVSMPTLGGKAIFPIVSASGEQLFWQTDGTASGTQFFFGPSFASSSFDLLSRPMAVFNNHVFCIGKFGETLAVDSSGAGKQVFDQPIQHFFEQNGQVFGFFGLNTASQAAIFRLFTDQPATAQAWQIEPSGGRIEPIFLEWQGKTTFFAHLELPASNLSSLKWLGFDGSETTVLAHFDTVFPPPYLKIRSVAAASATGAKRLLALLDDETKTTVFGASDTGGETVAVADFVRKNESSNHFLMPSESDERAFFLGDLETTTGNFVPESLWATDGTTSGTKPVAGAPNIAALGLGREIDGRFWFSGSDGKLWRTDGTSLEQVAEIVGSPSSLFKITAWDGQRAWLWGNAGEIWRSDGTTNGTFRVAENAIFLADRTLGQIAFFDKKDSSGLPQIWVSDGTTGGTKALKNASNGGPFSTHGTAHIGQNLAFFDGLNSAGSHSVWRTDGTENGTEQVAFWAETVSDIDFWGNIGPKTLFSANILSNPPRAELWATNGFLNEKLADDLPFPVAQKGAPWGGKIAFRTEPFLGAHELWTTDGTASGTQKIDVQPCAATGAAHFGQIQYLVESGGELWFLASACSGDAFELWRSDGTTSGTKKAAIDPCEGPQNLMLLRRFGSKKLLFSAESRRFGREPWIVDTEKSSTDEPVFSENQKPRSAFSAVPNPTDGLLFLKNEKGAGVVIFEKIWLTDALGRTVFEQKNHRSSEPIWLGDLPDGAYFLFQKQEKRPAEAVGTVLKKG